MSVGVDGEARKWCDEWEWERKVLLVAPVAYVVEREKIVASLIPLTNIFILHSAVGATSYELILFDARLKHELDHEKEDQLMYGRVESLYAVCQQGTRMRPGVCLPFAHS